MDEVKRLPFFSTPVASLRASQVEIDAGPVPFHQNLISRLRATPSPRIKACSPGDLGVDDESFR